MKRSIKIRKEISGVAGTTSLPSIIVYSINSMDQVGKGQLRILLYSIQYRSL